MSQKTLERPADIAGLDPDKVAKALNPKGRPSISEAEFIKASGEILIHKERFLPTKDSPSRQRAQALAKSILDGSRIDTFG